MKFSFWDRLRCGLGIIFYRKPYPQVRLHPRGIITGCTLSNVPLIVDKEYKGTITNNVFLNGKYGIILDD